MLPTINESLSNPSLKSNESSNSSIQTEMTRKGKTQMIRHYTTAIHFVNTNNETPSIVFTYRLIPVPNDSTFLIQSFGIDCAHIAGVPKSIVDRGNFILCIKLLFH